MNTFISVISAIGIFGLGTVGLYHAGKSHQHYLLREMIKDPNTPQKNREDAMNHLKKYYEEETELIKFSSN